MSWNMRNICILSMMPFMYGIFPCIALHITLKPHHVHCKHKTFINFGFVLTTYIAFPFPFSLLYNLSSFHQCLHFLWHSIKYKLLTKTLLSPSFSQKCSIDWSISKLSLVKPGPKSWCVSGANLWYFSYLSCLLIFISPNANGQLS